MSESSDAIERAEALAREAIVLIENGGSLEGANTKLREAASVCPGNASVKAAFERLRDEQAGAGVVTRCESFVATETDDEGEGVLDYIHNHQLIEPNVARRAMATLLNYRGDSDMADQITGQLLKNPGARKLLAERFTKEQDQTITYRLLYARGDDSAEGLTSLVLSPACWESEEERIAAERNLFRSALAQLMQAGEDHPERAMKCISTLLSADHQNLGEIVDTDGFGAILEKLDLRESKLLKGQATLATAKLFEQSPEKAQTLISQYVVNRVKKPTKDGLIQSFSAAAATFPMAPGPAAQLFLSEGFLVNLVKMVTKWKSTRLEQAALELLSTACVDRACRDAIRKTCLEWIEEVAETSKDPAKSGQASLILVKLNEVTEGEKSSSSDTSLDSKAQDQLVSRFKRMIISTEQNGDKQDSVEGLAYSSIRPKVKDELAHDSVFLGRLVKIMGEPKTMRTSLFGGLTIFANLTTYLPVFTEEQKKIAELKAYANSTKPAAPDELDDDAHVTARCTKVLDAGVIPLFISLSTGSNQINTLSSATQTVLLQILNSLSKNQKHRSKMAQQGALKLLLQIYDITTGASTSSPNVPVIHEPSDETAARTAAHALSRILISVNPSHVFTSSLPVTSAIRPLLNLLADDPASDNRNLLQTFEALLALTNIASTDDNARNNIIRLAWTQIEDLVLSDNKLVQRATVELICNLCASPTGVSKFADGSAQGKNRLHILLALADARDLQTRMAAGGALNMIVEFEPGVEAILKQENGVRNVLGMCSDADEGMKHRGLAALKSMIFAEGEVGKQATEALKKGNAKDVVTQTLKETRNPEILGLGVEVLKALM